MRELTPQKLHQVEGGDLWSAAMCGAYIGAALVNPLPIVDIIAAGIACGKTYVDPAV